MGLLMASTPSSSVTHTYTNDGPFELPNTSQAPAGVEAYLVILQAYGSHIAAIMTLLESWQRDSFPYQRWETQVYSWMTRSARITALKDTLTELGTVFIRADPRLPHVTRFQVDMYWLDVINAEYLLGRIEADLKIWFDAQSEYVQEVFLMGQDPAALQDHLQKREKYQHLDDGEEEAMASQCLPRDAL
ncbi:uncharacterized protein LTR77_003255 [Saxophila tyrrhenica]|uniref:Uncharacterized protein n=1 Tax=Saxophila tyrrhenica TaxID=1690608 RepID=A0AAV9PLE6_9PEZI|nr:hypothetical protein LTR77_003255 [Saxophila tyrrhenica]